MLLFFFLMLPLPPYSTLFPYTTLFRSLMKAGNFTELPYALNDSSVSGQSGCRSGNVILSTCVDPVAAKLMTLLPDPNITSPTVGPLGVPGSWTGAPNYLFATSVPDDVYSFDGRIDHNLSQNNRLFGSYSYRHLNRQDPPWTSNGAVGSGNSALPYRIHTQALALGWTRTVSNSMISDARFGFSRDYAHSDPVGVTLGTSQAESLIGLTGIPNGPGSAGLARSELT